MAARDDLKIREFHLQGHGSPPCPRAFTIAPDLIDERLKFGPRFVKACEIARKRVFGTDRFADAIGTHRPVVDAPADVEVV